MSLKPGMYEMRYRGLTFRECFRLGGGPVGFLVAIIFKITHKVGDEQWLPTSDLEEPCRSGRLHLQCFEQLQPAVEEIRGLGFNRGSYVALKPEQRDADQLGGYRALHDDGARSIFLARVQSYVGGKPARSYRITATGGLMLRNGSTLSVCNHTTFFDGGRRHRCTVFLDASIAEVADRLEQVAGKRSSTLRVFRDLQELVTVGRDADCEAWASRVKRGLYVPVSKSPPPSAGNS